MSLEVTGRLVKVMPEVTGEGKNGPWKKQEFVVETAEQFPKKICMSLWGDKTDTLKNYKPGDYLKVSINIESREYNERWYTDVRAWRIQSGSEETNDGNNFEEYPQQFNNDMAASNDGSDDLPF